MTSVEEHAATTLDTNEAEHRFALVHERRRFVAACACGWRSTPALTAGLAGALHDLHRAAPSGP